MTTLKTAGCVAAFMIDTASRGLGQRIYFLYRHYFFMYPSTLYIIFQHPLPEGKEKMTTSPSHHRLDKESEILLTMQSR